MHKSDAAIETLEGLGWTWAAPVWHPPANTDTLAVWGDAMFAHLEARFSRAIDHIDTDAGALATVDALGPLLDGWRNVRGWSSAADSEAAVFEALRRRLDKT